MLISAYDSIFAREVPIRRKVEERLAAWRQSANRKPLIVMGARQVGKTYSLLRFGEASYANVVHVDFAENERMAAIFEGSIDPRRIVALLSERMGVRIVPGETLVVFDEVQRCPEAIASLKYFCEQAPDYHVVAAGSLLGITVRQRNALFPVGKVDMLMMRPLDFEEYLWALGRDNLAALVREACAGMERFPLHDDAMELYYRYLLVGGMPEAVSRWVESRQMEDVRSVQRAVSTGYVVDIAQYTAGLDAAMVLSVWQSLPRQLAKENTKFQYARIRTGARSKDYAPCIEWLRDVGLVETVAHITDAARPLSAFAEPQNFKLYLLDTGLLSALYNATMADVMPAQDKAATFRGALAENYVAQQLAAAGVEAYYWGTASKSEVEFVYESKSGAVVPLEVKSGKNVGAKSARAFARKYEVPCMVRVSAKNFGSEGGVMGVPLYAAHALDELSL